MGVWERERSEDGEAYREIVQTISTGHETLPELAKKVYLHFKENEKEGRRILKLEKSLGSYVPVLKKLGLTEIELSGRESESLLYGPTIDFELDGLKLRADYEYNGDFSGFLRFWADCPYCGIEVLSRPCYGLYSLGLYLENFVPDSEFHECPIELEQNQCKLNEEYIRKAVKTVRQFGFEVSLMEKKKND